MIPFRARKKDAARGPRIVNENYMRQESYIRCAPSRRLWKTDLAKSMQTIRGQTLEYAG